MREKYRPINELRWENPNGYYKILALGAFGISILTGGLWFIESQRSRALNEIVSTHRSELNMAAMSRCSLLNSLRADHGREPLTLRDCLRRELEMYRKYVGGKE